VSQWGAIISPNYYFCFYSIINPQVIIESSSLDGKLIEDEAHTTMRRLYG
jgi:hypothetical protein